MHRGGNSVKTLFLFPLILFFLQRYLQYSWTHVMDMTRFKCGGIRWGWMRDFLSGVLVFFLTWLVFVLVPFFFTFLWWGWGRERTWEWEWESFVEIDWDWEREERASKGEMIWEREGEIGFILHIHTYTYLRQHSFLRWGGLRWDEMSVERCFTILQEVILFFVLLQFNPVQSSSVYLLSSRE